MDVRRPHCPRSPTSTPVGLRVAVAGCSRLTQLPTLFGLSNTIPDRRLHAQTHTHKLTGIASHTHTRQQQKHHTLHTHKLTHGAGMRAPELRCSRMQRTHACTPTHTPTSSARSWEVDDGTNGTTTTSLANTHARTSRLPERAETVLRPWRTLVACEMMRRCAVCRVCWHANRGGGGGSRGPAATRSACACSFESAAWALSNHSGCSFIINCLCVRVCDTNVERKTVVQRAT